MKILIVDDDLKGLDILRILLESKGYEVMAAQNGQEALEMAGTTLPGLVISDILMPVMDGFVLCREWKMDTRLKDIPFIFYTASYLDQEDEDFAFKIGVTRFIRKPVKPDEFMKIIQAVIENRDKGRTDTISPVLEEDKFIHKLYNERLVNRLEKKNIDLEKEIKVRKQAEVEKTAMEAQLRQAQKMESVGRLAGGVAHDYNNMLTVILGFTDMAMDELDPTGNVHANLKEVRRAARRAMDITRQLLAFARKQTISPIVLDLNKNVEDMLKMLRRLIGEDIDLSWVPGDSLWHVKMDPSQIDQVLANLCINARDAIEGVGKVTIETDTKIFDAAYCADHVGFIPGEFVQLSVSDNGCGMSKEIQDNLFEPFFTTKEVDKGTGLGLATVYGIVKQNNGFINVYSEPNKGTTFKIYLPRYEGKAVKIQKESTKEIPKGRGETILLVEDDLLILELIRKILDKAGYTVLTAGTPKEAMELAEKHAGKIHLLFTDVVMPEMNGGELARQLQSLYPDLNCVFMSGYAADVIARHGVLDEGVHFVQKPFSRIDLEKTVRKALDE